jgi:ethanolamine utilization protein EutN
MQIGRVIGTVVATQKHRTLEGATLLLVQPLTVDDVPRGVPLLTIDSVGAGVGEKVLIVIEGRAAGEALRRRAAPVDAAIVGIIDAVTVDEIANAPAPAPARTARRGKAAPARGHG